MENDIIEGYEVEEIDTDGRTLDIYVLFPNGKTRSFSFPYKDNITRKVKTKNGEEIPKWKVDLKKRLKEIDEARQEREKVQAQIENDEGVDVGSRIEPEDLHRKSLAKKTETGEIVEDPNKENK